MTFSEVLGVAVDSYITLLAFIFITALEFLIFTLIFKHVDDPQEGEVLRLRFKFFEDERNIKARIVLINLAIYTVLVPFVMKPLEHIMEFYLTLSGYYLIPLTFLAIPAGYLPATKHHVDHKWRNEDTLVLALGVCAFVVSIIVILRLGL